MRHFSHNMHGSHMLLLLLLFCMNKDNYINRKQRNDPIHLNLLKKKKKKGVRVVIHKKVREMVGINGSNKGIGPWAVPKDIEKPEDKPILAKESRLSG